MLNKLFSKIESMFLKPEDKAVKTQQADSTADHDHIQKHNEDLKNKVEKLYHIFRPLAVIEDQLDQNVVLFILDGENPEILLKLQQYPNEKALLLLEKPGTYSWYWPQNNQSLDKKENKLAEAALKLRRRYYGEIFEELEFEQIIRFAKVLEAATQQKNFTNIYEKVPAWFIYLTVDTFITAFDSHHFSEADPNKLLKQNWTQQKLFDLLESDQQGLGDELLPYLFERQNIDSYHSSKLDKILLLKDTQDFISARLDQLRKLIPTLSIIGQENFLDYIAKQTTLIKQIPDLIVKLSVGKSKTIRTKATSLLTNLNPEDSQKYLNQNLLEGSSQERGFSADLLARLGADNLTVLEQAFAQEKQKTVQQILQMAIQRLRSVDTAQLQQDFEAPTFQPFVEQKIPASFTEVILENYQEILAKAEQNAADEIEENKTASYKRTWAQDHLKQLKKINHQTLTSIVDQLNGDASFKNVHQVENIITHKNKYKKYPEFSINHAMRIIAIRNRNWIYWPNLFEMLKPEEYANYELRHIVQALDAAKFNNPKRRVAQGILAGSSYYQSLQDHIYEKDKIWPFFAENQEYLTEALGLSPSLEKNEYQSFNPSDAIFVLKCFPSLPVQFIPRLLEFALGENKRLRYEAQETLQHLPDIHQRAIEALDSGKQDIRITAIEWLARLQNQDAVKPLNALLKKEKKEIVRAALLTALEKLGQDISAYLKPEVLLKEAEDGLKGKLSSSFTWFDFDTLPKVKWQNGKEVDPRIIKWWVILAEKLKEPRANALLQRYSGLLDQKDQVQLANHLLHSFIHQDTLQTPLDEATQYATTEAPGRLSSYRDSYKRYGEKYPEYYAKYGTITLEEVIEEIKRERLGLYLGSAIKSKGMLSLTANAQGSFAVKQLQNYMKQHYPRRSQIEAMISALSISNDPLIIQLLLSLSRRYRTASVQTLANTLVAEIAERNQWTSDELADRTIPTAGLDENAVLQLQYGSRNFSAIVDEKDKFILKNEEGKEVKALPAARQNDDESLIKEAKALFSTSKKEFKQVIDMQTGRLYEAMCSERQWNVAEWQEYIFAHPIMRRLIQKLIWLEIKTNGEKISFRPSDDGALLNLDDDEVELSTDSKIQISHAVLVGEKEAKDWIAHFKDYKVKFLFEQMTHHLPKLEDDNVTEIKDHNGWLTDTFTLRGVVTKLGYQRASIEDGGSFDRYTKPYKQLGIDVEITFSGSYVPEENIPAVLYELTFSKKASRSWNNNELPLKQIPPILLAESYADYLKVAASTSGFDPEWEKKTPW
ncbi:DUF4132 domain-containing protein [Acinetobacter guillouiae]|uniref:DUF4132 domain-containing protein n=1 Tax=Acinetobacter guillouiae TaxID=106649 RepID=UPI003C6FD8A7